MRAYGLRVPVILASLAAVLAVLFGLQFLYARQAVSLPLTTSLQHTDGVLSVREVNESPNTLRIDVKLGVVPDLRATYEELMAAAQQQAGGRQVDLRIQDDRSPELTADYYKLNLVLAQGRATGEFVSMQQMFTQQSQALGLDRADVTLGNTAMFVTLVGGGHYLYQIMPLTLSGAASGGAAA